MTPDTQRSPAKPLKNVGNALILFALFSGGLHLLQLTDFGAKVWFSLGVWAYLLPVVPAIGALASKNPIDIPLEKMGEFAAVIAAAYYLTVTMAKLSGTALWIPQELRTMVNVLVSLLGEGVFNYVGNLKKTAGFQALRRSKQSPGAHGKTRSGIVAAPVPSTEQPCQTEEAVREERQEQEKREGEMDELSRKVDKRFFRRGLVCFGFALLFFSIFMVLRARCVKGFDVRDWLAEQMRENSRELPLPKEIVLPPGSTPGILQMGQYEYHIPEFVDVQRQQVYLPLFFPEKIRREIESAGKREDMDGLTYELAYEPNDLFDAIEKQAFWQVAYSNICFLVLDAAIVMATTAGMACFFEFAALLGSILGEMGAASAAIQTGPCV